VAHILVGEPVSTPDRVGGLSPGYALDSGNSGSPAAPRHLAVAPARKNLARGSIAPVAESGDTAGTRYLLLDM